MIDYTEKQGQYLAFIHLYTKLNGLPPAETDIQKYFRATLPSVHQMIVRLKEKGLIGIIPNKLRTVQVLIPDDQIPELGNANILKVNRSNSRNWMQENYIKAYKFAAEAHNGQLVPGTDLPYIMHISFVCMEVIACMEAERYYRGDFVIQCALLHDIVEDTEKNYTDVEKEFGWEVANGVLALTKDPNLAKEFQMQDSLLRIRKEPVEIWLVKLADRITNLLPPPSNWGKEKIKRYREESIEIYNALQEASKYLSKRLKVKISEYAYYL